MPLKSTLPRPSFAYFFLVSAAAVGGYTWWQNAWLAGPTQAYAQQSAVAESARGHLQSEGVASADQLSAAFRHVAKSLKPSVVSIQSVVEPKAVNRAATAADSGNRFPRNSKIS